MDHRRGEKLPSRASAEPWTGFFSGFFRTEDDATAEDGGEDGGDDREIDGEERDGEGKSVDVWESGAFLERARERAQVAAAAACRHDGAVPGVPGAAGGAARQRQDHQLYPGRHGRGTPASPCLFRERPTGPASAAEAGAAGRGDPWGLLDRGLLEGGARGGQGPSPPP